MAFAILGERTSWTSISGSPGKYPGGCFEDPAVTRYRRYSASSSRDGERMLRSIRIVYERQWPVIQGDAASEAAFHRGLAQLTDIFRDCLSENLADRMRAGEWRRALRSALLLARESPRRLVTATAGGLRAAMSETLRGTRAAPKRPGG